MFKMWIMSDFQMIDYKQKYMEFFMYYKGEFISSEISGEPAVDIHHIFPKGKGGDPSVKHDHIENLIALTRKEHELMGDKKHFRRFLFDMHRNRIMLLKPDHVFFFRSYDHFCEYYNNTI